jgi:hypothetical protein
LAVFVIPICLVSSWLALGGALTYMLVRGRVLGAPAGSLPLPQERVLVLELHAGGGGGVAEAAVLEMLAAVPEAAGHIAAVSESAVKTATYRVAVVPKPLAFAGKRRPRRPRRLNN